MSTGIDRRGFIGGVTAGAAMAAALGARSALARQPGVSRPVAISSMNGLGAVAKTIERLSAGDDLLEAAVAGVRLVEDDPNDQTVGLGGLPNEEGIVELDASVMHGPTHRAGAVAGLRNIKNPSAVALELARRTDHVILVGEGALKFARRMGFQEENLLTEASRLEWLKWRATLSREDDWLQQDEFDLPGGRSEQRSQRPIDDMKRPTGTIHCSIVSPAGDLAGVTTTSGLAWKLPGRIGDSPIIGAGLYTDNSIGSAGATGRGEAVIQVCGAHSIVERMGAGDHPTDACLAIAKRIVDRTRLKRLLRPDGRPAFNVNLYALRKDGAYGSASIWGGARFAVADARGARLEDCAFLFKES